MLVLVDEERLPLFTLACELVGLVVSLIMMFVLFEFTRLLVVVELFVSIKLLLFITTVVSSSLPFVGFSLPTFLAISICSEKE